MKLYLILWGYYTWPILSLLFQNTISPLPMCYKALFAKFMLCEPLWWLSAMSGVFAVHFTWCYCDTEICYLSSESNLAFACFMPILPHNLDVEVMKYLLKLARRYIHTFHGHQRIFMSHMLWPDLVHPYQINGFVTILLNIDIVQIMKHTWQGSEYASQSSPSKTNFKKCSQIAGNKK